jgi:hypothetical protein
VRELTEIINVFIHEYAECSTILSPKSVILRVPITEASARSQNDEAQFAQQQHRPTMYHAALADIPFSRSYRHDVVVAMLNLSSTLLSLLFLCC